MEWLGWLAILLAVVTALSAGLALGLHLLAPNVSRIKRILWSAGIAGITPMSVAFAGFLSEADVSDDQFGISLLALVVFQLVVLAVFTLPSAWFATTRLEKADRGDTPELPPGGDTRLIA